MLKPEHSKRFSHIVKKGEQPKPEKKIVIKRTPKPEKKIVIKRTPKPAAPKPEKKIVIKKPLRETPGSIEAKRIKKRIKIEKGKAPAPAPAPAPAQKKNPFINLPGSLDTKKLKKNKVSSNEILKLLYKKNVKESYNLIFDNLDPSEKEDLIPYLAKNGIPSLKTWWSYMDQTDRERIETKLTKKAKQLIENEKAPKTKPAPAPKPAPKPAPPKKTEPPKEKLIQFSEDDSLDRRTLFNHKIINSVNEERFKSGRPQYKTVQAYEKEALERRNKEAAEKRARTRARNQKKKQEETKTTTSNKTKDQFINDFMTSNINDLGFLGNERLTNIMKIINASSDKSSKYKFFYTTDFLKVLGYDVAEKLFFKYGVMPTFERIKKMVLKINPNKKVNIPERNNVTLKGFPKKLQNAILITLDKEKFRPILNKLLDKIKTISDLEKIKNEGQKEINNIDKNLTLKTEYRKPKSGVRPVVTVFLESVTNKIIASKSENKILK